MILVCSNMSAGPSRVSIMIFTRRCTCHATTTSNIRVERAIGHVPCKYHCIALEEPPNPEICHFASKDLVPMATIPPFDQLGSHSSNEVAAHTRCCFRSCSWYCWHLETLVIIVYTRITAGIRGMGGSVEGVRELTRNNQPDSLPQNTYACGGRLIARSISCEATK